MGWYEMSLDALADFPKERKIVVPFNSFIVEPGQELKNIYQLLKLGEINTPTIAQKELIVNHRDYKSKHEYDRTLGLEKLEPGPGVVAGGTHEEAPYYTNKKNPHQAHC